MADDFKALVALTKQTNAKLELLHKQGEEDDSPRERILDALPEILAAKDISKKETDQKDKLHREEVKKNKNNLEELKKADAERSKESTKNSQSIKQQNQMIVSEGHKDTAMIVDSLGNVEKSQSINEKIQLRLNEKPEGAAQEEKEQKTESFFKKLLDSTEKTSKGIKGLRDGILGFGKSSGASSFFSKILKAGLIGGMIFLVNFLSGPYFDKFYDTVVNTLIPAFVKVYEVLKPIATYIGGALLKLVKDIGGLFGGGEVDEFGVSMGPKSITEVLLDNKAAIAGIVTLLAPGLVLKGLFAIPLLLTGAFGLIAKRGLGLVNAFRGTAGAAPISAAGTGLTATGPVGKVDGRSVVRSASGKLAFAGADGKATTELLSKEQQKSMKAFKPASGTRLESAKKIFPRLFAAGKAFAPLGAIIGGAQGIGILLNENMSFDQKKTEFGRLLGGTLGSIGLGTLGAVMGSVVPGVGTAFGAVVGGLLGAVGGDYVGRMIADILMGGEPPKAVKELSNMSQGISKGDIDPSVGMFAPNAKKSPLETKIRELTHQAIQASGNSAAMMRAEGRALEGEKKTFDPIAFNQQISNSSNYSQGIIGSPTHLTDPKNAAAFAMHFN